MTLFRYSLREHARSVGPGEQDVVPLRQEAHGRRRLCVRQRRARDVEKLAPLLVTEAAQRLEQLQRRVDLGTCIMLQARCRGASRGRKQRGSGGRSRRAPRPGRARPARRSRRSGVRSAAARAPSRGGGRCERATRAVCQARRACNAGEAVLALELGKRLRRCDGAVTGQRAHRRGELLRPLRLPGEVRLAHRRADKRIVARGDEMQRPSHHRRLHDRGPPEQALERLAPEARRPRPDADVRRRRPLRLHPDQALDHRLRREPLPLQQELPRERRPVQLAQREDALGHRGRTLFRRPLLPRRRSLQDRERLLAPATIRDR